MCVGNTRLTARPDVDGVRQCVGAARRWHDRIYCLVRLRRCMRGRALDLDMLFAIGLTCVLMQMALLCEGLVFGPVCVCVCVD